MPVTVTVPVTRTGGFYAWDYLTYGDCTPGSDDQSGVMYLDSPVLTVPSGGDDDRPLLVFDHYVATELAYDGGNVSISVNGGQWQSIAPEDFSFNPYNSVLDTVANGNTNPLAGQAAFNGTDEGEVTGSWGQSHIELGGYASVGDEVQVRFAFGVDGCNGIDGWYLDSVETYYCQAPVAVVSVEPDSLSSEQLPDLQVTEVFTIGNSGDLNLEWNLFDGLVVERERNSSSLGWDAQYLTEHAMGSYPADQFTLVTDTVITGLYAGGFALPELGLAAVTDLNWYIYADSGGEPAGYPSDGGGTELWSFTGLPTTEGVDISDDNIRLDLDEVGESLQLSAGTYWLVIYVTTTQANQWFWYEGEGISALVGNQDEYWIADPVWLSIGVGLEFTVYGFSAEEDDCTRPSDTDWLDVDPFSGTVVPGPTFMPVEVVFDSTGMTAGDHYTGTLCVQTNDLENPLVEVALDLLVIEGAEPPVAGFSPSATTIQVGEVITFENTTVGDAPITYVWDFGDTMTSTATSPAHLYEAAGSYTVTLTATNEYGSDVAEMLITVEEIVVPLVAGFSPSASTVEVGEIITFENTTVGEVPITYLWDFGDTMTSTATSPSHLYEAAGSYTVTLTATDANGTDVAEALITVNEITVSPVAGFSPSATTVSVGEIITFDNTTVGAGPITYLWDFGDEITSTATSPAHSYAAGGIYTVTLTATNAGGSDLAEAAIFVTEFDLYLPLVLK